MRLTLLILLLFASSAFAIDISACMNLSTFNGNYKVTNSFTTLATRCFNQTAQSVAVDFGKFSVTGINSAASYCFWTDQKGLTITNWKCPGFVNGLYTKASDTHISGGPMQLNLSTSIIAQFDTGADSALIDTFNYTGNNTGLYCSGGKNGEIRNTIGLTNGTCWYNSGCSGWTVTNLTCNSSIGTGVGGFYTGGVQGNVINRSNFLGGNGDPFQCSASSLDTWDYTNFTSVGKGHAMRFTSSCNFVTALHSNMTSLGSGNGNFVSGSSNNTVGYSRITSDSVAALQFFGASQNSTYFNNTFNSAHASDVFVQTATATGNLFYNNTFIHSNNNVDFNASNNATEYLNTTVEVGTSNQHCQGNIWLAINSSYDCFDTNGDDMCDTGTQHIFNQTTVPNLILGTNATDYCPGHGRHYPPVNLTWDNPAANNTSLIALSTVLKWNGSLFGAPFVSCNLTLDGTNVTGSWNGAQCSYNLTSYGNHTIQGWLTSRDFYLTQSNATPEWTFNLPCASLNQTITGLPATLICPNTTYNTSAGLTVDSSTAITVAAENITVDCSGLDVNTTTSGDGIYSDQNGTKVKNCHMNTTASSVHFVDVRNGSINNSKLYSSNSNGITLEGATTGGLMSNLSSTRLYFNGAFGNSFSHVAINGSSNTVGDGSAITFDPGSENNTITDSNITPAAGFVAIDMFSVFGNLFLRNNVTGDLWVSDDTGINHFSDAIYGNIWNYANGTGAWVGRDILALIGNPWAVAGADIPISNVTFPASWIGFSNDSHPYTLNLAPYPQNFSWVKPSANNSNTTNSTYEFEWCYQLGAANLTCWNYHNASKINGTCSTDSECLSGNCRFGICSLRSKGSAAAGQCDTLCSIGDNTVPCLETIENCTEGDLTPCGLPPVSCGGAMQQCATSCLYSPSYSPAGVCSINADCSNGDCGVLIPNVCGTTGEDPRPPLWNVSACLQYATWLNVSGTIVNASFIPASNLTAFGGACTDNGECFGGNCFMNICSQQNVSYGCNFLCYKYNNSIPCTDTTFGWGDFCAAPTEFQGCGTAITCGAGNYTSCATSCGRPDVQTASPPPLWNLSCSLANYTPPSRPVTVNITGYVQTNYGAINQTVMWVFSFLQETFQFHWTIPRANNSVSYHRINSFAFVWSPDAPIAMGCNMTINTGSYQGFLESPFVCRITNVRLPFGNYNITGYVDGVLGQTETWHYEVRRPTAYQAEAN